MEIAKHTTSTPCWVDLGTPDLAGSTAFYSSLFGWEIPPGDEAFGGYTMGTYLGANVAGFGPQQNPGPPYWSAYICTEDVELTAKLVAENGGQVLVPPMDIADAGRMAVFMDPAGAAISAWQPGVHIGAERVAEPNTLCWIELITTDVEGSKEFYAKVFGWKHTSSEAGPPGGYTEWNVGEMPFGGMMQKNEMMPADMPSVWSVYFAVADCDAAVAKVKELGGAVIMEPQDIEPGRFAICADPTGAMFQVITLAEGVAAQ